MAKACLQRILWLMFPKGDEWNPAMERKEEGERSTRGGGLHKNGAHIVVVVADHVVLWMVWW